MKKILYILLFPFSIIYGIILYIRNKSYDWNLFSSVNFNFPVIVVGNLNVGGVGKTPHVEYLIRLLEKKHKLATLSRGYKRKTTGFKLASEKTTILDIGDEPLQYYKKFKNVLVAVDEKRVNGIQKLKELDGNLGCIILDDAFQHRAINAGLNILITDYNNLYIDDSVLPSGRLREWKSGMKRAQIIIVSKCDANLNEKVKSEIIKRICPYPYQKIYFSAIKYGDLTPFSKKATELISFKNNFDSVLAITGISNPTPFLNKIKTLSNNLEHLNFPDHHQFDIKDINDIKTAFKNLKGNNKIIITTEKDFMRLSLPEILINLEEMPLFYVPIEIYFLGDNKKRFDTQIEEYVTKN